MTKINKNKSAFQFTKPILKEAIFLDLGGKLSESNNLLQTDVGEIEEFNGVKSATVSLTLANFEELNDSDKEDFPYLLRVTMESKFRWETNKIDDSVAENLLRVNAPSLLLSYIRPIVSGLTVASAFQEEVVPFIDFTNNQQN
ncbi:protein-export chaperone SecB [Streptococcus salivarius]|uniref:protein-export chaperone SecB n=1 Tax=Streptococcus salivarius TaxID=1304 RepID=UPI001FCFFA30|nr:protein-export chaperone SecB [Streptococcus salivarius]UOT89785.1 protein-export chaperone SecB [Streptococcus salivarius]